MSHWKLAASVAGVAAAVYALVGAGLVVLQDRLVFPAPTVERAELSRWADRLGATEVELVSADGTRLYAWHRAPDTPVSPRRAVLLFHGNAETVASRVQQQDFLLEHGWEVFVFAYRGYPGSEGSPEEAGIVEDGLAAWAWLTERVPRERVVLHGKSLGGGVAAAVAERVHPAALVLESTFLSIPQAARDFAPVYPTGPLMRIRFDTASRAPGFTWPVLVLHGDADHTVRVRHGRGLYPLFPDARYVEIAGGDHNRNFAVDDPAAQEAYLALLRSVAPDP